MAVVGRHDCDQSSCLRVECLTIALAIGYWLAEEALSHGVSIALCFIDVAHVLLLLLFLAAGLSEGPPCKPRHLAASTWLPGALQAPVLAIEDVGHRSGLRVSLLVEH